MTEVAVTQVSWRGEPFPLPPGELGQRALSRRDRAVLQSALVGLVLRAMDKHVIAAGNGKMAA